MDKVMTDYLNFLKNTKKSSDNTIQAYKRDLNLFLEYIKANNILTDLRELMLEYCKETATKCIDLQTIYKEYSKFHDGIHPTVEGYDFIGRKMAEKLSEIF